jgi:HSP20 family protein
MTLVRYQPLRQLLSLPEELNRFFGSYGLDWASSDVAWVPSVDVAENEKEYEITAELPGLKKEEIGISFEDHVLKLHGERKQEEDSKKGNVHRVERNYGRFERVFRLPEDANSEAIKAKYENGVLTVQIPKTEKAKPKAVEIA